MIEINLLPGTGKKKPAGKKSVDLGAMAGRWARVLRLRRRRVLADQQLDCGGRFRVDALQCVGGVHGRSVKVKGERTKWEKLKAERGKDEVGVHGPKRQVVDLV